MAPDLLAVEPDMNELEKRLRNLLLSFKDNLLTTKEE